MARYNFQLISKIDNVEIIVSGKGVRARHYLSHLYGRGRWRKMKGTAVVEYDNGDLCLAELHWFEASGIGRKDMKSIKDLERLG